MRIMPWQHIRSLWGKNLTNHHMHKPSSSATLVWRGRCCVLGDPTSPHTCCTRTRYQCDRRIPDLSGGWGTVADPSHCTCQHLNKVVTCKWLINLSSVSRTYYSVVYSLTRAWLHLAVNTKGFLTLLFLFPVICTLILHANTPLNNLFHTVFSRPTCSWCHTDEISVNTAQPLTSCPNLLFAMGNQSRDTGFRQWVTWATPRIKQKMLLSCE